MLDRDRAHCKGGIEVWWHATVIALTLLATAATITVVSRAINGVLRTRAVIVADRRYEFDKHPAVVCLTITFWLCLIALMLFASAVMISDLPSIIKSILPGKG
jgi:hypothetical protein